MPIIDYLGNFHPLLVHLPIGILLIALLLVWGYFREPGSISLRTLQLVILSGAVAATLSSATGYIIAGSGSYEEDIVAVHQWFGIALTIVSWLAFILSTDRYIGKGRRLFAISILAVAMLFATGHAGGTLTHGSGFLNPPPVETWFTTRDPEPVSLDSSALLYEAVHLVLAQKCISCHGATKQRGGLRLDAPEYLHSGGDSGPSLIAGNAGESLIVQRLLLPYNDEQHMPPEGRTQPTVNEIALIRWWVDEGASLEIRLLDASLPGGIVEELLADKMQSAGHPLVPTEAPEPPAEEAIVALRQQGTIILPVSELEMWMQANLLNVQDSLMPETIAQLLDVRDQLIWLSCTGKSITTAMMKQVAMLKNLRKIDFRRCQFEQGSLQHLSSLSNLKVLNLSGASFDAEEITAVKLPEVEILNLGLTGIGEPQLPALQDAFPNANIEITTDSIPL
jgi:hypothetical protein